MSEPKASHPVVDSHGAAPTGSKRARRGAKNPLPELDPHEQRQLISDPLPAEPPDADDEQA